MELEGIRSLKRHLSEKGRMIAEMASELLIADGLHAHTEDVRQAYDAREARGARRLVSKILMKTFKIIFL